MYRKMLVANDFVHVLWCRSAREEMEAGDLNTAASLMTAALNFFEAASQLNNSDIKLVVSVHLSQAVLEWLRVRVPCSPKWWAQQ